jgi:hypothetical protein
MRLNFVFAFISICFPLGISYYCQVLTLKSQSMNIKNVCVMKTLWNKRDAVRKLIILYLPEPSISPEVGFT